MRFLYLFIASNSCFPPQAYTCSFSPVDYRHLYWIVFSVNEAMSSSHHLPDNQTKVNIQLLQGCRELQYMAGEGIPVLDYFP